MNVVFRVDASLAMGSGHVMRCLTLARALREKKHRCVFISRSHPGSLNSFIKAQGFDIFELPIENSQDHELPHANWLGASQEQDAECCRSLVLSLKPDWLVVDHYALDYRWERSVVPVGCRLFVIDDLADRIHYCDALLDQNLGKHAQHYRSLVPESCILLTGPRHALLRPEFMSLRGKSLIRRQAGGLQHILISLGGVDLNNYTGAILKALKFSELPLDVELTVIMGALAPHKDLVEDIAKDSPWPITILSGISDMAERLYMCDLAIGAGGGSSWERCCLGVPTLLFVLAQNQFFASNSLREAGAVKIINSSQPLTTQLKSALQSLRVHKNLKEMSDCAASVCDGQGVATVVRLMEH